MGTPPDNPKLSRRPSRSRAGAQNRAPLDALCMDMPMAYDSLDAEGRILDVNQAWLDLLGYRREEVIGHWIGEFFAPHLVEELRENWPLVMSSGVIDGVTVSLRRKDGALMDVRVQGRVAFDDAGKAVRTHSLTQDLRPRRELERELLENHGRENARLGHDLHDGLGQMLTGLSCMASALRDRLAASGHPAAGDAVQMAEVAAAAMKQTRILAHGLAAPEDEARELREVLADLACHLESLFQVRCTVECPAGLRQLRPSQFCHLQALVREAVCNAVRHGKAHAVAIHVRAGRGRLNLSIRNDGRPLAPGFRRARGLGLNLMHYRAAALGGSLLVADHPEGGVVVRCALPWKP